MKAVHATCEDSINIFDSTGNIKSIEIENAHADALDVDFSRVNIENLIVRSAHNDCADFSLGHYHIKNLNVTDCGDKGISVAENSKLSMDNALIKNSVMAISSKDFSIVETNKLVSSNVEICLSAYQKKQEFGGAVLKIGQIDCDGRIEQDDVSSIQVGELIN